MLFNRSSGGVYNVTYDEKIANGTVFALYRSCPSAALLPEALPSQTRLPVERTLVRYDLSAQVCSSQRSQPFQEDGHFPPLFTACLHF